MTQFSDLGLAESVLRGVTAEGYTTPTPIQAQVIPAMMEGSDVVGIAQTGTGKTAAFVLPILHDVAQSAHRPAPRTCTTLIIAPTRELAQQIADNARTYGRSIRPILAVIVGGAKHGPQIRALHGGADVVIATPGRLEDHLESGHLRLDATTTVVLDEADQMLDLGFFPAIRRILSKCPKQRRTVLLSATMPKQIRALAEEFLHEPREISVAPASTPIDRIAQFVVHAPAQSKRTRLVDLLSDPSVDRAIVFTRTKYGADRVAQHLDDAGLRSAAIHGDKSQGQRQAALNAFKAGRVQIMVATDIAARGIDIDDVSHVVNFELPTVPESYVHRIGRTARAGKSGVAISLCDPAERGLLRDIERLIGRPLPRDEGSVESLPVDAPGPKGGAKRGGARRGGPNRGGGAGRPQEGRRSDFGGGKPAGDGQWQERRRASGGAGAGDAKPGKRGGWGAPKRRAAYD